MTHSPAFGHSPGWRPTSDRHQKDRRQLPECGAADWAGRLGPPCRSNDWLLAGVHRLRRAPRRWRGRPADLILTRRSGGSNAAAARDMGEFRACSAHGHPHRRDEDGLYGGGLTTRPTNPSRHRQLQSSRPSMPAAISSKSACFCFELAGAATRRAGRDALCHSSSIGHLSTTAEARSTPAITSVLHLSCDGHCTDDYAAFAAPAPWLTRDENRTQDDPHGPMPKEPRLTHQPLDLAPDRGGGGIRHAVRRGELDARSGPWRPQWASPRWATSLFGW